MRRNYDVNVKASLYGCKISLDTDTAHDINISSGYKTLTDGTDFNVFDVTERTKRIDANWAAGDDAGGFPSGLTLAASTWYYIFTIGKTDGTFDAGFDTSATAANLLTDATSYTYYGVLGALKTDASSNIDSFVSAGAQENFAGAIMLIEDQKAQNTSGGTFTSGAWRTRDLTTIVADNIPGSSLATNQFTLKPGNYKIKWSAPAYEVSQHQSLLYNITATAIEQIGSASTSSSADAVTSLSNGEVIDLVAVSTTYEIQHQCNTTAATSGFGLSANFTTEVYTQVSIEVISLTLGDL